MKRKRRWTEEELKTLKNNYETQTKDKLMEMLPDRTWQAIRDCATKKLKLKQTKVIEFNCDYCDKKTSRWLYEYKRHKYHFCNNECKHKFFTNENNPCWKGGKIMQHGYVLIRKPVSDKTPYTREHRVVVESELGKKLDDDTVVHHVNGKKDDNRPENLIPMSREDHTKLHWRQGDFDNR